MQVAERHCDVNLTKLISSQNNDLPDPLRKSLEKIAIQEGYLSYKLLSRTISTEGGNYMASLYEIDIKGQTKNGEKETNVFVKYVIPDEYMKIFDISDLYSKELFFYADLRRVFREIENEAAVPDDERYKSVKAFDQSNLNAIILQNLAKDGFGTVYRMNIMPLKFAELAVQQLAKFHALSFVLEKKRPRYFERKIKALKQSTHFDENFTAFCHKTFNDSTKGLDRETLRKLHSKLPSFIDEYSKYLSGYTKTKCLCHGDFRMNNVLMKIQDGEITEVIPVDYQLLYFGSPIIDFIYFIFGATDTEFRENHLEDLKELYYSTMGNYLKYFDISINSVYPRKEFEQDYFECLDYSLYFGLFSMPFLFALEGDVPNFSDILNIEIKVESVYIERLNGIIEDMIKLGKF